MDFLTAERARCCRVFESVGGTVESVQALAIAYKRNQDDRVATEVWSAIAIALELQYRRRYSRAIPAEDAWMLGYETTCRALRYWRPSRGVGDVACGRRRGGQLFVSYAITCYLRGCLHWIQEHGTVVKIERNTAGWADRYRAMQAGNVAIDHQPETWRESVQDWGSL